MGFRMSLNRELYGHDYCRCLMLFVSTIRWSRCHIGKYLDLEDKFWPLACMWENFLFPFPQKVILVSGGFKSLPIYKCAVSNFYCLHSTTSSITYGTQSDTCLLLWECSLIQFWYAAGWQKPGFSSRCWWTRAICGVVDNTWCMDGGPFTRFCALHHMFP